MTAASLKTSQAARVSSFYGAVSIFLLVLPQSSNVTIVKFTHDAFIELMFVVKTAGRLYGECSAFTV